VNNQPQNHFNLANFFGFGRAYILSAQSSST
jgi:hypothetical protein